MKLQCTDFNTPYAIEDCSTLFLRSMKTPISSSDMQNLIFVRYFAAWLMTVKGFVIRGSFNTETGILLYVAKNSVPRVMSMKFEIGVSPVIAWFNTNKGAGSKVEKNINPLQAKNPSEWFERYFEEFSK